MMGDENGHIDLVYRFDKETTLGRVALNIGSGGKFAFLPASLVSEFTEQAKGFSTVTLKIKDPVDGETKIFTMPLKGLAEALPRLKGCK
jgi:hypothetical protein